MRSGTENTAGIVGAARAFGLAAERRDQFIAHCVPLRDALIEGVLERIEGAILTGHPTQRLANNASFAFPHADGEAVLMSLDVEGIAASIGSACTSGTMEISHVLEALRLDEETAGGSLRLTLGFDNTRADIDRVLTILPSIVERARAARKMSVG